MDQAKNLLSLLNPLTSPCNISFCSFQVINRLEWTSTPSKSDSNCSTEKVFSLMINSDVSFLTFQVQQSEVMKSNSRYKKDKAINNGKWEQGFKQAIKYIKKNI